MTYLFFGIGLFLLLFVILNWVANAPPKKILGGLKWIFVAVALLVGLLLIATGRFGLIWFMLVGLLPWISRILDVRRIWKTMQGPSAGNRSSVRTAFLDMSLDHETGTMDGTVLQGRFQGRTLSGMTLDELRNLYREAAAQDPRTAELLDGYADKVHGEAWHDGEDSAGGHGRGGGPRAGGAGSMSREEALAVLGLEDGADEAAIKEAHRRMMKNAHPDAGGSDYLAAKVNQAKDVLLGG